MTNGHSYRFFTLLPVALFLFLVNSSLAQRMPVRRAEGLLHGFLVLRDLDNNILASGDLTQVVNGTRITSEMVFHFKDGSIHEEKTVFSQKGVFQLLDYKLVQKGPSFKRSTDLRLNAATGQVTNVSTEKEGNKQTFSDRLSLPANLANGLINTLLNDLDPKTQKTTLSLVVATPKPRLVRVEISPDGEDSFQIGGSVRKAIRYVAKIRIGGIAGIVAPIIGKDPPDTHVWMFEGTAPVFLKSEGPLCEDCPIWRIELASPVWSK